MLVWIKDFVLFCDLNTSILSQKKKLASSHCHSYSSTTLLHLSKHLHHHRHGDLAGLTSRSEGVGDGDDGGRDDAGAP